jgi:membrane-associated phospholipid phosphatase
MAVADAFISCWHSKYRYHLMRPISYIQQHIDAGWGVGERALPVVTPPFPEYTSGHSVQTAAFAQVLFDLFGDFPFTDHTHDERGLAPRSFSSCFAMAEETAISRLYGGIHFRAAIEQGLEQGKQIGRQVSALRFAPA